MRINAALVTILATGITLAACSGATTPEIQDSEVLATNVAGTLTALPTVTEPPPATLPPEPTELPPDPTSTPEPEPTATSSMTPMPSETPTQTGTPAPTSTLPADDVRNGLGGATWLDDFSTGNNWPLGEDDFTRATVEDGELRMTGLSTVDGWRLTWPEITDFYLEMTVKPGDCSGNDHYGLIVRVPDKSAADRGYLAGFSCHGRYSLRLWDSEEMTNLLPPTENEAIRPGSNQTNRMGIWVKGDRLAMYANGMLLREIRDDTFLEEGSFGIWVGARQTEDFTIFVDEIAYWDNP